MLEAGMVATITGIDNQERTGEIEWTDGKKFNLTNKKDYQIHGHLSRVIKAEHPEPKVAKPKAAKK